MKLLVSIILKIKNGIQNKMTKINLYDCEWEEISSNKYDSNNMNHLKIECFDNYYYYKKIDKKEIYKCGHKYEVHGKSVV